MSFGDGHEKRRRRTDHSCSGSPQGGENEEGGATLWRPPLRLATALGSKSPDPRRPYSLFFVEDSYTEKTTAIRPKQHLPRRAFRPNE